MLLHVSTMLPRPLLSLITLIHLQVTLKGSWASTLELQVSNRPCVEQGELTCTHQRPQDFYVSSILALCSHPNSQAGVYRMSGQVSCIHSFSAEGSELKEDLYLK